MSDRINKNTTPDDLFRNRLIAALGELDQPETDADIEAALDAVDAEFLSNDANERIMKQVRHFIARPHNRDRNHSAVGRLNRHGHSSDNVPFMMQNKRPPRKQTSFAPIIAACLALIAVAIVFLRSSQQHDMAQRSRKLPNSISARLPVLNESKLSAAKVPLPHVEIGDMVVTGPREKRRVTLPDGSILSINEQSQVSITGRRRVKLLAGEVFTEVMPTGSRERFVVETPHRTVTALGTKFNVKAQSKATSVVVTQGKVQVSGVNEIVRAGHELIADLTDSSSVELRPAKRSAHVIEWVKDLMAAAGSIGVPTSEHSGGTVTVVDPQGQEMKLSLRKFHIDIHIEDGFARTTIDQTYFNHTWQQLEGTFRFPLPSDSSLSRLAMYVDGKLMEGGMVERDYGRNVFEQIRHTRRDPALLEWVDGSTFQMRVFPLEARQEKRILLSYTQRLQSDYGKSVYRFPMGNNLEGVREWSAHVRAKGGAGTKWYSPSHLLNGHDEQGDLVIEGRDEYAILNRDLVVELGEDSRTGPLNSQADWSVFTQEGFRYVMLRQRPELKANATRTPRHWVFLFENSADRNSILAETQRQIATVLLENTEHSDTFSIVRAGTEPDTFERTPVDCSIKNVARAQEYLRQVLPIGALDLGQALQTVNQQVHGDRDAWIVHLGTGIPVLGERDQTTLLRLLPPNVKYVGVAVGKRWSKSFMETAASRSGGHVTQINPDEAVTWRAFDLLSTLNAPRLTEIGVREGAGDLASPFLLLTNSLAHGQELAAVARISLGQALPKSVTITGKLNGQAYSQSLDLPSSLLQSADGASIPPIRQCGHLPRTWARLEIDRLMALGSTEHKAQIIELSKTMYVMSPFTSLLVLETEAMYEQFKVDRGRKDHWAMYPAPAQIPVVTDQGGAQVNVLDAAKDRLKQAQSRARSAQTNLERSINEKRPAADIQRFERMNRADQAVVRLIENEIQRIEQANVEAANPSRIAWDSVIKRRSLWEQYYVSQYANNWGSPMNYWGRWGKPLYWSDATLTFDSNTPIDLMLGRLHFVESESDLLHSSRTRPQIDLAGLNGQIPSLSFVSHGSGPQKHILPILDAYYSTRFGAANDPNLPWLQLGSQLNAYVSGATSSPYNAYVNLTDGFQRFDYVVDQTKEDQQRSWLWGDHLSISQRLGVDQSSSNRFLTPRVLIQEDDFDGILIPESGVQSGSTEVDRRRAYYRSGGEDSGLCQDSVTQSAEAGQFDLKAG